MHEQSTHVGTLVTSGGHEPADTNLHTFGRPLDVLLGKHHNLSLGQCQ